MTDYGHEIDISDIEKSSRGATATFEDGLLDVLEGALADDGAAMLTAFTTKRSDYATKAEFQNEKQRVGALIAKHVKRLVRTGRLPHGYRHSTNWHPVEDAPQVSRRR